MSKSSFLRVSFILFTLLFGLTACNLPRATPQPVDLVFTQAAQTVQAQLTLDAFLTPATQTPAPEAIQTVTPELPTVTLSPTVGPSPTPLCDLARFITDVTIPDGTVMQPGQTFTKTWRLRNLGTCAWTSGYQLIFDQGNPMSGPVSQPLAGNVPSGNEVDLSVALKAPDQPGAYRGYWRLRNPAGVLLPVLNGYQGVSFFVDIKVALPTDTPTVTPTPTFTPTVTPTETPTP